MTEETIENIEDGKEIPLKVEITNQEKPIEKEATIYDSQDDPEYLDIDVTQEQFEKDVDENNGS